MRYNFSMHHPIYVLSAEYKNHPKPLQVHRQRPILHWNGKITTFSSSTAALVEPSCGLVNVLAMNLALYLEAFLAGKMVTVLIRPE